MKSGGAVASGLVGQRMPTRGVIPPLLWHIPIDELLRQLNSEDLISGHASLGYLQCNGLLNDVWGH